MVTSDTIGAFCDYGPVEIRRRQDGVLAGLTCGIKDLFDIEGLPTGAGSPEWLAAHPAAASTAPAVAMLLDAGATVIGKTHMDEMAWSLNGENAHFGTPVNVAAPGRIPGGSSSGSAAATAAGLVDFALGSDTGGSVRLPASYCGIWGIRPTHGRIPIEGAVPLAPSYDTVGWFARSADLLAAIGTVFLGDPAPQVVPDRLILAEDLFALAGPEVTAALADAVKQVEAVIAAAQPVAIASGDILAWRDAFRIIQPAEAWAIHGEWVTTVKPAFGPGVRDRFAAAARIDPADLALAKTERMRISSELEAMLRPGTIIAAPTTPGVAPLRDTPADELEDFRARALALLCPAGHAGLPQISMPLATIDGLPVGLSLIGARGSDAMLLRTAARIGALAAGDKRHG
jgi:amidase